MRYPGRLLLCCAVILSFPLQATASWHSVDPGLDFWGHTLGVYNGDLYVGGFFGAVGTVGAASIARYNGTTWSCPGGGMPRGYPAAFAVHDGRLIAGGTFNEVGGLVVHRIAAWDGTAWTRLGFGFTGTEYPSVKALEIYDGKLIAAGSFLEADGGPAAYIAQWDGVAWSPLGSGVNAPISTLAVFDGKLVAGGAFTEAGGAPANYIAQWDGATWSPLGAGVTGSRLIAVWALKIHDDKLVAGGVFQFAGSVEASNIAQWDGASWSPLGKGIAGGAVVNGAVGSLEIFQGKLYAAGLFNQADEKLVRNIAAWDGASWSPLEMGVDNGVLALGVYNDGLIVTGAFITAGGYPAGYIARWDSLPRDDSAGHDPPIEPDPGDTPGDLQGPGTDPMDQRTELLTRASLVLEPQPRHDSAATGLLVTAGTTVSFALDSPVPASLSVYNLHGALVKTLAYGIYGPGRYEIVWDGRDCAGGAAGSGIYFCRLKTPAGTEARRLLLVR